MNLSGKTVIVTGASRGIGRAIALRAARDGANVVIAAKTIENTGKLRGTIHEVAREVEAAGGRALPIQVDVRDADRIAEMVARTVQTFGGVDVLVNNAGAIMLATVEHLPLKRFDLMMAINVRAAFAAVQACLPHLKKSPNPHVLSLSPPIRLRPEWFARHTGYTLSKFGLSLLTLGLAEELRGDGIAVNSLWPKTLIATAAIEMLGGEQMMRACRTPEIMADAFYAIVTTPSRELTGRFLIDEELLRSRGVTEFSRYRVDPAVEPLPDLFVG